MDNLFVLWLITSPTPVRSEGNTTTGSIIVAAPQLELGSSPTSYIPRRAATVTRTNDIVRDDLNLSVFRLYGSSDFTGSLGESIVGLTSPPGESIVGPPGSDASTLSWIDASQSNVLLESFGS